VKAFVYDHIHNSQRECRVSAGLNLYELMALVGGVIAIRVDADDFAPFARASLIETTGVG
jgi:hypothetical protein